MKIICAGLPKTGTTSLAEALRILGFTVHDYEEQMEYHAEEYIQALDGKAVDFAAMYTNVDAITDAPSSLFWKELKHTFPNAKVILMERESTESWAKSRENYNRTLEDYLSSHAWLRLAGVLSPTRRKWRKATLMFVKLINSGGAGGGFYNDHNARVKDSIPRDELLVYNVKQGWKPLCNFLGLDVPNVPFPRLNVKADGLDHLYYHSAIGKRVIRELVLILSIIFSILAILIFLVFKKFVS